MRRSIFFKTYVIILSTIIAVLLLSWLFISFFADDFYYNNKLEQIKDAARDIHVIFQENNNNQNIANELKKLSIRTGADISIFNHENQLIFTDLVMDQQGNALGPFEMRFRPVPHSIFQIKKGEHIALRHILQSENIDKFIYGERYSNGILTVIQIPIEAIDETVDIFKDIIQYMMLSALLLGAIGAFILSKNITSPLVELNNIAMEMGKLNFSKKYQENREDEIGQLGQTLNKMADALQYSISQLQEELKKEKTLDVLRKQFVAQVSHEMQTPLTVVQGYIEALEDGLASTEEDKRYHYEVINDEMTKMTKMIKEILDLSQLEAGTFQINKENFDMIDLIRSIYNKYTSIAKQEEVSLYFEDIKEEVIVHGDKLRIEQVLTNFIKNAFEHTEKYGEISILTELFKDKIKIEIINTGKHIPGDDIPYIWESFYKAKNKKANKGTGLGLAISKHILNLHEAKYGVKNVSNGVMFWFDIAKS